VYVNVDANLGISPKRGIWPRDQNQSLKIVVFLSLEENVLKTCDGNREDSHLCSYADDTVRAYEIFDQAGDWRIIFQN